MRLTFVDKVTKELISQLLDDIFNDGVVNDGEKDSVLEENVSRADKARCLIDTVRRKGDEASRKMIAHIQRRDPTLYAQLGLSCGSSAPPAAEPQMEQKWSTNTTRMKMKARPEYPVTQHSSKNRVALLVTNIKFTDEKFNRNGAEKDEENMEKLLTFLGYEVVKHTNLTGKAIDEAIIKFSKHPKLKDTDSVLVVIMSHGKLGVVLGVDCKNETSGDEKQDEFPINNIYKHLGSDRCPALLNKPKIIIIQACRGAEGGSVLVSEDTVDSDHVTHQGPSRFASEENIDEDTLKCVHREKDFISLLSSTPDCVSYRQREHGSFLIQYIVDVFTEHAREDEIEELFRKVMQRFEECPIRNKRQMPTKDRCTLTKCFYFFQNQ